MNKLLPTSLHRFLYIARPPKRGHVHELADPRLGSGKNKADGGQVLIEADPVDGDERVSHQSLASHIITGANSLLFIEWRVGQVVDWAVNKVQIGIRRPFCRILIYDFVGSGKVSIA